MRIMFISDIHGIRTNLDIIKKYDFDTLVILGDLYHNGFPHEDHEIDNASVKDFIMKNKEKIVCLKGNCDHSYDYVDLGLPVNDDYIKIVDKNITMYCSHGHKYNYRNFSFLDTKGVVIYGHEHVPYIEKVDGTIYICVGSISRPREGSKASFCRYESGEFTLYSVEGQIINSITI